MVLIVCAGNSARSQMAEGLLQQLARGRFIVRSAGAHPKDAVHPLAVEVMAEIGIDIHHAYPKPVHIFLRDPVRVAICVCDEASRACAIFPQDIEQVQWTIPDPAAIPGTDEACRAAFRQARDLIAQHLDAWITTQVICDN